MRITVSKENCTIKDDYIKLAEFYDAYSPTLFIKSLIDEAYENGNTTIKVDIDFPKGGNE